MGARPDFFARRDGSAVITVGLCQADLRYSKTDLTALERTLVPAEKEWVRTAIDLSKQGISVIWADTARYDFRVLPRFDLVFIDGCHTYQGVKNDTEKALECLRDNGMLIWHDFHPIEKSLWPGVRDYLNELASQLTLIHLFPTSLAMLET